MCHLREIRERNDKTLRELETETGIHRGQLSRYENGRELVADKHETIIEEAYGAPAEDWYPPRLLLMIQPDHPEPSE